MSNRLEPGDVAKLLEANIARGRIARKQLSEKLAQLPPEQIARLPRVVLARFAPDAIATLARALARTDGILPVAEPEPVLEVPAEADVRRSPLWAVSLFFAILVIEITFMAISLDRPARWSLARLGVLSGDQLGLCARLDRWTDRCSYPVRGSQISLDEVAARLLMTTDQLAATNPLLPRSGAVSPYASIVVDRFR